MGWSFMHRPKGTTDLEFFSKEFRSDICHIVDVSRHGFNTVYIAYHLDRLDANYALICLIKHVKDQFNFGFKSMDEFMGSYEYHCPERILKLLSPLEVFEKEGTPIEYAKTWREECWKNVNRLKSRGKLAAGRVYRLPYPLNFSYGNQYNTFYIARARPLQIASVISQTRADGSVQHYLNSPVKFSTKYLLDAEDVTREVTPLQNMNRLANWGWEQPS